MFNALFFCAVFFHSGLFVASFFDRPVIVSNALNAGISLSLCHGGIPPMRMKRIYVKKVVSKKHDRRKRAAILTIESGV